MLTSEYRDVLLVALVLMTVPNMAMLVGMVAHKVWIYRSLRAEFGDEPLEERTLRLVRGGKDSI